MKFKSEYIIFVVLGIVVLYALSKIRQPDVQQVPEFIGTGPLESGSQLEATRAAERTSMFQTLAAVAGAETQADLARYQTGAQLQATEIGAGVQRYTAEIQERLGLASLASSERRAEVAADVTRFGFTTELEKFVAGLQTQETLYELERRSRESLVSQQLGAIQNAAYGFRNQSLERQGTILNAINQTFGGGAPYSYQAAFGGPRGPSVLSQLLNAGQNILGMFL